MVLKTKKNFRDDGLKQEALDEVVREEKTRLNVDVPLSLYKKLKLQAINEQKNTTITKIVIQAINEYLDKYSNE
jgi:hypothetical protein